MDPKQFGMHSLQVGGATAAANAGVLDRLFKCHGRLRSETAKDGYVKDSDERRLTVSKGLGVQLGGWEFCSITNFACSLYVLVCVHLCLCCVVYNGSAVEEGDICFCWLNAVN